MPVTLPATITVDYRQLGADHGFALGFDPAPWITRPYLVSWDDLDTFLVELRGLTTYSGTIGAGVWKRNLPHQDLNNKSLFADSITVDPEGALLYPTDPIAYSHAVVKVTYRRPPWDVQTSEAGPNSISQDPTDAQQLLYASQEIRGGARWYDQPNSSVTWSSDGAKVNTPIPRRVKVATWNITYHLFPYLPSQYLEGFADTVNNAPFLGRAKGTVMLVNWDTIREINSDGSTAQKVQLQYEWRQQDWNKYLRPDNNRWDWPKDVSGNYIYNYADYSALLAYFS